MATSSSRVVAVVGGSYASRSRSLVLRRLPSGRVEQYRRKIGVPHQVSVDRNGNITIASRRHPYIYLTTWRRPADRPTIRRVDAGEWFELLTNSRGDAALVVRRHSDLSVVMKGHNARRWQAEIALVHDAESASLADFALTPDGRLAGAFPQDDHTVQLRILDPSTHVFSTPRVMVEWPELPAEPNETSEFATLSIGPGGRKLVALTAVTFTAKRPLDPQRIAPRRIPDLPDDHHSYQTRVTIVSPGRSSFSGDYHGGFHDEVVVGLDGSVASWDHRTIRWSPDTHTWQDASSVWPAAHATRGDLLLADDEHERRLSVWPLGKAPYRVGRSPRGNPVAWALANSGTAYVLTEGRGRPGYHLSTKRLDYR